MFSCFIASAIFSFTLALPVGAGSVMMLRNGLNKHPFHAFWTGLGMNPTDIVMMTLYYFGLSKIFQIHNVQIGLYAVGIFLLGKLSINCFKRMNVTILKNKDFKHSIFESFKDGVVMSIIPSSLITWCALYGTFLSSQPYFFIACIGILVGFLFNNLAYAGITWIIKKLANEKILKYVNAFGGTMLLCFALYFFYKLCLLII